MTFTAVVTTGIYCRAPCSGRPLAKNVTHYAFAAAAEANGFRPCRLCRPDQAPPPSAWSASSERVCRALQAIADGRLDEQNEAAFASSMGIGARQLRRLFHQHVGASPSAIARSHRAHLLRRLLDATDLPVTTLAFAAGFSSVRQMNHVVREIFKASPTELRRKRRKRTAPVLDGGLELDLPYHPPFDWRALLALRAHHALDGIESVSDDCYRRTIVVNGNPGVIELSDDPGARAVRARLHLPELATLAHIVAQIRRMLDLDTEPGAIAEVLSRAPRLAPLLGRWPGVRLVGSWDVFECAVRAALDAMLAPADALRVARAIVARYGQPLPGLAGDALTHTFPDAAALVDADLTSLDVPPAVGVAIRDLARARTDGAFANLTGAHPDETLERLNAIGLGDRAGCRVAQSALGERDVPTNGDDAPAWRPWRSYAAVLLELAALRSSGVHAPVRAQRSDANSAFASP